MPHPDVLGPHFLGYVLNLQVDELHERLQSPTQPLDADRLAALQQLVSFLSSLDVDKVPDAADRFWRLNLDVLAMRQAGGDTWPNAVRNALGGSCELRQAKGTHRQLLMEMARDTYPAFLIPNPGSPVPDPFTRSLGRPMHNHPLRIEFEQAVLSDVALASLFPEEREGSGWIGNVMRSTGSGGTLQLWGFAETLLKSGWQLARLDTQVPTLDQFSLGVMRSVDTVRKAAAGRKASVSTDWHHRSPLWSSRPPVGAPPARGVT